MTITQKQTNIARALYSSGEVPLVPTDESDMEIAAAFVNLGIARIDRPTGYCNPYLVMTSAEKCLRFINARQ